MEYDKNYTVYHLHDDTSNANGFMDSCSKYQEYIDLAKQQGMKSIAFSNHGGIYDWIKKKQACDKAKIKYIHGIELYICVNLEDKNRGQHIGLYSKNLDGVKELNKLISKSTLKDGHFYFNPRISLEELMNTSDNIIVTTACLASPLWNWDGKNRNILLQWLSDHKDRCFLEIQYHNCDNQKNFNELLYRWSKEYDIPLIAGTDTHSSNEYKAECRKVLQKSKNCFYGEEDEFDLTWKTYDELVECFKMQDAIPMEDVYRAIENTNILADMVEDFELDKTFKYPNLYENANEKLWELIDDFYDDKKVDGAIELKRFAEYDKRIKEEYDAFVKQDMCSFIIFMSELMTWCRSQKIYSSFCRGSVGGSLIAYILNITDVDPLKWNTVFSRFCNAERISLADIDEDFSPKDRKKVYEYIINKFGSDKVSYILTLGTIQDRGSIDVLAKGLDYQNLDQVKEIKDKFDNIFATYSKIIIEEVNLEELEGAESKSPSFIDHDLYVKAIRKEDKVKRIIELKQEWDNLRAENKDLFYYFDGMKGTIVSKGIHTAGMIGSPITLDDNLGVFYRDGDINYPVSTCTMKAVDSLNYVKFDILGLKTIGIIQDTYELLGEDWKYAHQINWNDEKVWEDMNKTNIGIFQFEGDYAGDLLTDYQCTCINDMSLVNASLRPSGKSYRNRLIAREFNNNPSKEIDELLKDNHGFLVFQEDTIKFLTDICGFSGSLADTTRRAIGKKDKVLLEEQLPKILDGYCNNSDKPRDIAELEAKEFIQIISDSSEYQFGYNHSTGYSMNGYVCAMLRYYHPLEFTTAYLKNSANEEDLIKGKELASIYGIKLKDCKFRYSRADYFMNKETNTIYKGIASIKYLNKSVGEYLYTLKDNTYETFTDLLIDINKQINSKQLTILINLDFFEEFGKSGKLLKIYENFDNFYNKSQINKEKYLEWNNILKEYATKETAKLYKFDDTLHMLRHMEELIPDEDINIVDKVKCYFENTGSCDIKDDKRSKQYIVLDINVNYTPKVQLYSLSTGKTDFVKIGKKVFRNNPLAKYDLIYLDEWNFKNKRKKVNDEWQETEDKEIWATKYWKI